MLGITKEMLLASPAPRCRWGNRTSQFHRETLLEWVLHPDDPPTPKEVATPRPLRRLKPMPQEPAPTEPKRRKRLRGYVKDIGVEAVVCEIYEDLVRARQYPLLCPLS